MRWAAEHGLVLDDSLTLRDEGLSAYHQRHVKQGALGIFLLAIEEGRISPGSVLIVEGLDRLSRAEPIQAQAQLAQIVNAGITVVTASDGKEYNREQLKSQPMDLVYSLLVMIRAHEESDTKSERVKAAMRRQCEQWQAGTYRGLVQNGKDPQWLRHDGEQWHVIPERAEAVKLALDLFRQGYGAVKIVQALRARNLKLTNAGTNTEFIYRLVRLSALVGTKSIAFDGEVYELKNYYPPLIEEAVFSELQGLVGKRAGTKVKGEIPGIITGMTITRCGYCGQAMVGQNLMTRKKLEDGRPQAGHRRLICVGYSLNTGCPVGGSCSVVPVENAIMEFCSDQLNLSSLASLGDRGEPLRTRLAQLNAERAQLETQLSRVTDALLAADDGTTPLAFVRKARQLEESLQLIQNQISSAERELAAAGHSSDFGAAEVWAELVEQAQMLDYDARMKARKLVSETFEKIVVYHRSTAPDSESNRFIDLLLIAKGGGTRMLRIERKSGRFSSSEDVSHFTA